MPTKPDLTSSKAPKQEQPNEEKLAHSPTGDDKDGQQKRRASYLAFLDDDASTVDQEKVLEDGDDTRTSERERVEPPSPSPSPRAPSPSPSPRAPATPQRPGAYLGAPGEQLRRRSDVVSISDFEHQDLERQASTPAARLAVATQVPEDQSLREAEEVDPAELENQASQRNQDQKYFCLMVLVLSVLVAFLMGAFLGLSTQKRSDKDGRIPTTSPTMAPTNSPSSAPSGALDYLLEGLPDDSLERLDIFGSPQWKAMDWLQNHPQLAGMEEWRKKQLFSLVTFFYSMEGEDWPDIIRDNWLLYDTPECLWFDTVTGEFNELTGTWEEEDFYGNRTVCNELDEFQLLDLVDLELAGDKPKVPPEIALLSSLSLLSLPKNDIDVPISDFLPSQLYGIPNLTHINLYTNSLTGQLPSTVGSMAKLTILELQYNNVTGPIPSELGTLQQLEALYLYNNQFTGFIPSEIGQMTALVELLLSKNHLTGSIPSQLGLRISADYLWLQENDLTGAIPVEVMQMVNLRELNIQNNYISGSLPPVLALLTNLEQLVLDDNDLTGTIPPEFQSMRVNGSLTTLTLANNSLSGLIPEGLCLLGQYNPLVGAGLSFDCSYNLCGCCWCPCPGSNYSAECQNNPFLLNRDDQEYPGAFPNQSNAITINTRADGYPEETWFDWSVREESGLWTVLESSGPTDANKLQSYTMEIAPESNYKLTIFDDAESADGTCCGFGYGWFSIATSIPSGNRMEGTVIWEAPGYEMEDRLEVFLSVDAEGQVQVETSIGRQQ